MQILSQYIVPTKDNLVKDLAWKSLLFLLYST